MLGRASEPRADRRADRRMGAASGQVIVLFALFLTAMLGVLGLAIDLGFAFAQRRSMQNAADAGAMAGAWTVARWTKDTPGLAALPEVAARAADNRMGDAAPQVVRCDYVDDADQALGPCSLPVPARASGVAVTVREEHPTFFLQVVPGAPERVATGASATAHVQRIRHTAPNGPFLVCGKQTQLAGGGTLSILTDNNTINQDAVGKTFVLHDPSEVADCGLQGEPFKGIADQTRNDGRLPGEWWVGTSGDQAGPVRSRVAGIDGCADNAPPPYGCVVILPVFTDDPAPRRPTGDPEFFVVLYAAFRITSTGANSHVGVLLDDYIDPATVWGLPSWTGGNGWARDAGGVVLVRLTE
jgi:hypothetical protein